ncbi:MAG TPA: sugar phosphate isomerase/epimerase [Gemmataceae bacterium]|jgi:sugar phosphate isomerase/epimerase|nr:sugar phosphate isomerase/epimerase [Gemmataceae bacterium]
MFDRQLSRRDMLRSGAAAIAAASFPSLLTAKDDEPVVGFTLAMQSYTFRNFKLDKAVAKIAECGVKHVEFFRGHVPVESTPEQIKAVSKLCGDSGITPVSFGVEGFSKDHDANKKKFDFGAALGVKCLTADPSKDSFDSLDKLCAEYKIAIGIHPHGPSGGKNRHQWWSAEVIMAAVKDHNELIGTCLDTGHLIRMAQLGEMLDPVKQIHVMGKRNFGMHLKDHDNKRKTDVIYGQDGGVLDVPGVLKALKEEMFKGYIAIEYEAKPEEPTADVKELVKIVKESAKKLG